MSMGEFEFARYVADWIEYAAIAVIAIAVVVAFVTAVIQMVRSGRTSALRTFRNRTAGGLLVGLDLLIAADIIRSVTIEPTIENIAGLGLLVVIRTFLSWTLIVESEGRWPWQRTPSEAAGE